MIVISKDKQIFNTYFSQMRLIDVIPSVTPMIFNMHTSLPCACLHIIQI